MPFEECLQLFLEHVVHADAWAQIRQRLAWSDLSPREPLLEGVDRLENLGLVEVQLGFSLEPAGSGWAARLSRWVRSLFGAVETVGTFRLVAPGSQRAHLDVSVKIGRQRDGTWAVSSERLTDTRDVYVSRIVA